MRMTILLLGVDMMNLSNLTVPELISLCVNIEDPIIMELVSRLESLLVRAPKCTIANNVNLSLYTDKLLYSNVK